MADLCGKGDKYIEVLGLGHQLVLPSLQAPFTDEEYMKKAPCTRTSASQARKCQRSLSWEKMRKMKRRILIL